MIRYIELTPDANIAFQSGKITRVLINEGDAIEEGDPLFVVDAQGKEVEILARKSGKVNEIIVDKDEVIHKLSSLLVLETTVADPPAPNKTSAPVETENKQTKVAKKEMKKKRAKKRASTKKTIGDSDKQASIDFEKMSNDSVKESTKTQENNTTMSEIKVPDLGGADAVEVIDILVNVGDTVSVDDPLMTVESDKASMDIPASSEGTIESITVKLGDNVSEGDVVFKLAGGAAPTAQGENSAPAVEEKPTDTAPEPAAPATSAEITVTVPDLGGAGEVDVIDLLVAEGDTVEADQPLLTVESDKASMDVPSSAAGTIKSISVNVGDKVNEGDAIAVLSGSVPAAAPIVETPKAASPAPAQTTPSAAAAPTPAPVTKADIAQQGAPTTSGNSHASPSVRRLARELGVDLNKVTGTARKNRISKDDVKSFVKGVLNAGGTASTGAVSGGMGIPEVPAQDFSKFGEIELKPLNKIKRVTAQHMHRSWLNVPHVTHSDEANIASLEDFRKTLNAEYAKQKKDVKLSPLAFIVKAVVSALKAYPQFNSSLENGGENMILKNYYNIGIAVETPNGLVVPVIRDADKLSVAEIAQAMGGLAKKARDGKLTANDMSGGTFTISSLGGIGGTHFTPVVNTPEVAILGVARTKMQPTWNGSEFEPAPILPLCLSYDHRAIDGAEAARFTRYVAAVLEDLRRLAIV